MDECTRIEISLTKLLVKSLPLYDNCIIQCIRRQKKKSYTLTDLKGKLSRKR